MFKLFNAEEGTQLRSLINLLTVGVTTFGLKLHPDQIALVQATLVTLLALFVQSPLGSSAAPSPSDVPVTTEGLPGTVAPPAPTFVAPTPATPVVAPVVPVDNGVGYDAPESGEL